MQECLLTKRRLGKNNVNVTEMDDESFSYPSFLNRFVERLSTLQWDSMTTVDEMENEEEIKMEIREEYNKR